jgi:hypothetical protein
LQRPEGLALVWKWLVVIISAVLVAAALVTLLGMQLPQQHVALQTSEFPQSPQQVWNVIFGPPTWRPEVKRYELITPDPHRKWIEYGRHGEKMTFEVVEADPRRKLVTRIADPNLPFGGTWTYQIRPTASGTSLTITEHGEIYNPVFRFVARNILGYNTAIDKYLKAMQAKLSSS